MCSSQIARLDARLAVYGFRLKREPIVTTIRVFDLETTGIDPQEHRVIEIAAFDLHPDGRIEHVGAHLVNPGRAIPPEASAVHHLIDDDVAAAPSFENVWSAYQETAPVYYAAHNCEFEQGYIPTPPGTQWICTHKCALRAWDDAPSHGNQVLRYWIGLDRADGFDRQTAAKAHRAEADAYVTAWVLRTLLDSVSVDQLLAWTAEPKIYPSLNFGKHRGQKWAGVPGDYLQWLRDGQHQMEDAWRYGAKVELQRRTGPV
jgi:exodeoxyribonuclease X